jgi:hypothetical protein
MAAKYLILFLLKVVKAEVNLNKNEAFEFHPHQRC